MRTSERRGPLARPGLTAAFLAAFAVLVGLGLWQVQRLQWKQDLLARIEAARNAPPQPLAEVLRAARAGQDVSWRRAQVDCLPGEPDRHVYLYGLEQGGPVWRVVSACPLADGPWSSVLVDRGVAAPSGEDRLRPPDLRVPAPRLLTGVLREEETARVAPAVPADDRRVFGRRVEEIASKIGAADPAPFFLMVQHESPAPAGIRPAPAPVEISNRHLGYAITWFGLAAALAAVYAAMLLRGRPS